MSRPVFLAFLAPGVVVAVTYWISVGWMSDTYDTERWAKVGITAVYAMVFLGLWAFIAALGAALVSGCASDGTGCRLLLARAPSGVGERVRG